MQRPGTIDPREREAKEAKERQRRELLDRAYDQVVAKQLEKIGAKKTFTGEGFMSIICCLIECDLCI